MRRSVAAIVAAAAVTLGVCGCTVPTQTVDAAPAAPSTSSGRPPTTRHTPPPIPAPVTSAPPQIPPAPPALAPATPMAPTPPPAPATSAPLPPDLASRIAGARDAAAARGADLAVALLDRSTGERFGTSDGDSVETASVAKLFIADAMLHRGAISAADRDRLARMLERSDDNAANELWIGHGGDAVVRDVAARYGLGATTPPWDGNWWNTETTADDLVDWYAGLLDGRGGLDRADADETLGHLRASTPLAADGYDQRFGVPDALPAQPPGEVAVKQGWMCCTDGRWVHLSTAVVGPDARYVLVVAARETVDYGDDSGRRAVRRHRDTDAAEVTDAPESTTEEPIPLLPDTSIDSAADDASAAHARETMTEVVRILFPEGRIG